MPEKKPAPKPEPMNPAVSAHMASDPKDAPKPATPKSADKVKPEAEDKVKPADKAPVEQDMPKPEVVAPEPPPAPAPMPRRTIDELLADPHFDPDGLVRMRLAALVREGKGGEPAPADLVDDAGEPVRQMPA